MDWTVAKNVKRLRSNIAHGKEFAGTFALITDLVSSKRAMILLIERLRKKLPETSNCGNMTERDIPAQCLHVQNR